LPLETVLTDNTGKYVYVVTNGNAHRTPVVLGMRGDDRYEIKDGLQSRDVVVTDGASNLSDNLKVKIVP
jgi:multidrug efflux pump subunit AcrA (membrane-fusion protein)